MASGLFGIWPRSRLLWPGTSIAQSCFWSAQSMAMEAAQSGSVKHSVLPASISAIRLLELPVLGRCAGFRWEGLIAESELAIGRHLRIRLGNQASRRSMLSERRHASAKRNSYRRVHLLAPAKHRQF